MGWQYEQIYDIINYRISIPKAIEKLYKEKNLPQAVVQGGSFEECMKAVEKGAGSALSDLDAYKKAVKFYFPTATILSDLKKESL